MTGAHSRTSRRSADELQQAHHLHRKDADLHLRQAEERVIGGDRDVGGALRRRRDPGASTFRSFIVRPFGALVFG